MKGKSLINHFWREIVFGVAILLPWIALLPLGLLWLWSHRAVVWWFAGAAVLGVIAFAARIAISRSAKGEASAMMEAVAPASPDWSLREREAWRLVEQIVRETEPFAFSDPEPIKKALLRTIDAVAEHYHPGADQPRLRITLPDFLLLVERSARNTRKVAVTSVPGARLVQASDVLWIKKKVDAWGPTAKNFYESGDWAIRVQRLILDPQGAALNELRRALQSDTSSVLLQRIKAALTSLLIRECGRAAIDLYSGNLRLSHEEIARAGRTDEAAIDEVGPVRILLAGQVNAGKSSLFNALAGKVHRQVGVEVSRQGAGKLLLSRDGGLEVILREMAGLPAKLEDEASFLKEALQAHLVIWVASATQPARDPDVRALTFIRDAVAGDPNLRMPALVLALTHIDQLSPRAEWSPPYDLRDEKRPKAKQIQEAVTHVSSTMDIGMERVAAICVRDATNPSTAYGVEDLWALIVAQMNEARAAKIAGVLSSAPEWTWRELYGQACGAGRFLDSAVRTGGTFGQQTTANT